MRLLNPQQINLYVYAVNNPFSYLDATGAEVAQLGKESEEDIKRKIKEKEQLLGKDKKNESLKADIASLKQTLSFVQEGNKVIGAWLQALKDRGEDNGLTLSDFKISTNPTDDLVKVAKAAGKSQDFIDIGKYEWGQSGTTATVIGKDIYILRPSSQYQISLGALNGQTVVGPDGVGDVPKGDIFIVGGSALRHEQDHRDNGATETTAYTNQINLLDRINQSKKPFQNQKYFAQVKRGYQNLLKEYQSREGIK